MRVIKNYKIFLFLFIKNYDENSNKGYFLEGNVEYPKTLFNLDHGLILKKVHRVIQFNQKAWLKPYIDINTKVRKEAKMNLKRIFLS